MTAEHPHAPTPPTSDDAVEVFLRHRPRLLGIAYRLLGSMWDAEDVVADALERWQRVDRRQVREPLAYLTTIVSRLALDQLRSARAQRETYVGPWLPEPVLTAPSSIDPLDPLDAIERRETLSLATLHMLERLTPPERAVFVLREAFEVPYDQIADILGITPGSARQLRYRARTRLADATALAPDVAPGRPGAPEVSAPPATGEHATLLDELLAAMGSGDLDRLEGLLAADVVAYTDGGGKVRAARWPVVGTPSVVDFAAGLLQRFGPVDEPVRVEANGQPAALLGLGGRRQLLGLDVRGGRIRALYGVLNPDKLRYIEHQLAHRPYPLLELRAGSAAPQPHPPAERG